MDNYLDKVVNIIEIKRLMKDKKISKRKIADDLGFKNIGSLSRYIKWARFVGNNNIYNKLLKISNILGVDIKDILLDNKPESIIHIVDLAKNKKMKGVI